MSQTDAPIPQGNLPGARRHLKRWGIALIKLMIILICLGLIVAWFMGTMLCGPANRSVSKPVGFAGEEVIFPSESGSTIHGWLMASPSNRGIVILQHGVRANRTDMLDRVKFLSDAGYGSLLFDFQAHGESLGKAITFGHLESRDSQAAVAFVKGRFPGKPIAVIGASMGAAAAALAQPPLDVQAIVLESMYPTIVEATKDRLERRLGRLGRIFSPVLTIQVPLRSGCSTDDLRPIENVANIKVPKLFLAGTEDLDTKISESKEIFNRAAEPKQFVPFEGARHEDLHKFARTRYEELVLKFLKDNLK